jgi:hypothetical protein
VLEPNNHAHDGVVGAREAGCIHLKRLAKVTERNGHVLVSKVLDRDASCEHEGDPVHGARDVISLFLADETDGGIVEM